MIDQTRRLRLDLRYDGTDFHGWAKQDGLRTVQGEVEAALATILRQPAGLTVAGRTDAGVHARAQVAHLDIVGQVNGEGLPTFPRALGNFTEGDLRAFRDRLNALLGASYSERWRRVLEGAELSRGILAKGESDVILTRVSQVSGDFDARFSALQRSYEYLIVDAAESRDPLTRRNHWWTSTGPLSTDQMRDAAQQLLGEHDFLSFCKPREGATTIRTLRRLDVERKADGAVEVHVEADAFCHSMVRSLVGALVEVGRGAKTAAWARSLVDQPTRGHGVPVAPARGLTLLGVSYPPETEWALQSGRARRLRTLPGAEDCGC
ncbi:tRNA pseudouridine(38-40) synthase TruA [Actinomyces minihominis]|uniref:tRNA pseudouridine(38-40) synthase TruA n=1 Tax=Actinomyces minihominis TaxID=2002838 RepID=UPI000C08429F|nr:tRNA pseudouridine(38-40) synthase TruA [Actinomyces minihominis]